MWLRSFKKEGKCDQQRKDESNSQETGGCKAARVESFINGKKKL
jgi:hypothetical protein